MKPFLKLYRGYANEQELIVMGHVFNSNKVKDYDYKKNNFKNAAAIINLFRTKTVYLTATPSHLSISFTLREFDPQSVNNTG